MSGNSSDEKVNIGNPRDIQGVIAVGVIGGVFAIAGIAIAKGADVVAVLNNLLPLGALVVGFYFGQKSQQ